METAERVWVGEGGGGCTEREFCRIDWESGWQTSMGWDGFAWGAATPQPRASPSGEGGEIFKKLKRGIKFEWGG